MLNRLKGSGSHISFMCFSPKQKECKTEQWSNSDLKELGRNYGGNYGMWAAAAASHVTKASPNRRRDSTWHFVCWPVLTLTVITPFRPTFFIASEIILPISWSPFADIVATWKSKIFNFISQCKVFSDDKKENQSNHLQCSHFWQGRAVCWSTPTAGPGSLLEGLRLLGSSSRAKFPAMDLHPGHVHTGTNNPGPPTHLNLISHSGSATPSILCHHVHSQQNFAPIKPSQEHTFMF